MLHYRELIFFLVWRDLKVRYKQTVLGVSWAIIQPTLTMIIFTIFLGRLAKVPSDNLPYPIFVFAALVPWTFLSVSVTQASNSILANANMVKKVFFPRLALPISAVFSALVDFLFAFSMLILLMFYYGRYPTIEALWIPVFLLITMMTALGVSFWLSAMNVQFRDVRYAIPFIIQIWFFSSPVVYPSSMLSETWRAAYSINPMVSVVEGFRWSLLGGNGPTLPMVAISLLVSLALLVGGLVYFIRLEKSFADVA